MAFLDNAIWKAKYLRLRTMNEFDSLLGGIRMEIGWAIDDSVVAIKSKFQSVGTNLALSDKKLNELATASCELEAMKNQMANVLSDISQKEHFKRCELGLAISLEFARMKWHS